MPETECPFHPDAIRCTHVGEEFVVVREDPHFGLAATRGTVGQRGSLTGQAGEWEEHWIEEMRTGRRCWENL